MSADRNSKRPMTSRVLQANLSDLLDFGPETDTPQHDEVNQRILRIVKTLKELSDRLDKIASSQY